MYSFLRELVVRVNGKSKTAMLSVPQEFAIGYLSGIASRSISTPLTLLTVRLQTARASDDSSAEGGALGVCQRIVQVEGFLGFWKGLVFMKRSLDYGNL